MWRYAAGSVIGSSHEQAGMPRQDRLSSLSMQDHRAFVAAVADGAGSAAHSDVGAELVVQGVTSHLARALDAGETDLESLLRESAGLARQTLADQAHLRSVPLRELASTLLAVVVCEFGAAAMQIGDGVIVVSTGGDDWSWVFWPQNGEYANTTHFLTQDDALSVLQVEKLQGYVTDVALMSDGLQPLVLHYATQSVHEPFFRPAFAPLHRAQEQGELRDISRALEQLLLSPRIRSRTDDDVSLVIGSRRQAVSI
jgi:hypothetical protein